MDIIVSAILRDGLSSSQIEVTVKELAHTSGNGYYQECTSVGNQLSFAENIGVR